MKSDNINMEIWDNLKTPPTTALKKIGGGRLSGMTDINPQWRWEKLTETFGPCGDGWHFNIVRLWTEPGSDGQVMAFAHIELFIKQFESSIPGIGGSMLISNEKKGPYSNDEAFKMAVTDALGTASKMVGLGSDIYMGKWDGSKYKEDPKPPEKISQEYVKEIKSLIEETSTELKLFLQFAGTDSIENIDQSKVDILISKLKEKKAKQREPGEEG